MFFFNFYDKICIFLESICEGDNLIGNNILSTISFMNHINFIRIHDE